MERLIGLPREPPHLPWNFRLPLSEREILLGFGIGNLDFARRPAALEQVAQLSSETLAALEREPPGRVRSEG